MMKDSFATFQDKFIEHWKEYLALNIQLDTHRGKEFGHDAQEVEKINELLLKIQDHFAQMSPALEFVIQNYKVCVAALNEYNIFIEDLKRAGSVISESKIAES